MSDSEIIASVGEILVEKEFERIAMRNDKQNRPNIRSDALSRIRNHKRTMILNKP